MLTSPRYATVVYLTRSSARPVVQRAVASLPAVDRARVAVRELPAAAHNPAVRR
jgi:hypothetical protein